MANKGTEIQIGDGSLHIGDRVVYPNQGICRITGVEVKQIAGRDWEVVTLSREEDGATVMVPRAKVMGIGLRKVASVAAIDDMFDQLAAPGDDPQLDWKVRHRENADRMTGGGLQGTLDVLKGLHALSRVRPLPQKERELYDSARHLLVGEIAAATNLPLHVAEDNLDYALWPPPGMKRKGRPLQPAALGVPDSSGPARAAARAGDDGMEDEVPFGDEVEVEGDGETKAVKAADQNESEIADESETKDLVRQRAMRVTAEEEEPEALDELAEDALEAAREEGGEPVCEGQAGRRAQARGEEARQENRGQEAGEETRPEGQAMIRLVTLSEFPSEVLEHVARRLHAAYGMGCEIEGEAELPESALADDQESYQAPKLLEEIDDDTQLYADDKIVYLTNVPLAAPEGPMGKGPMTGFPQFGGGRAVVTSHGLGAKGELPLDVGLAKRAAHHVGHLWELHHCFDPRCARPRCCSTSPCPCACRGTATGPRRRRRCGCAPGPPTPSSSGRPGRSGRACSSGRCRCAPRRTCARRTIPASSGCGFWRCPACRSPTWRAHARRCASGVPPRATRCISAPCRCSRGSCTARACSRSSPARSRSTRSTTCRASARFCASAGPPIPGGFRPAARAGSCTCAPASSASARTRAFAARCAWTCRSTARRSRR